MAYSAIEQRYVDLLITAAFPDAVSEPEPMAAEPSLDGVQLAAGPSATRTDAPAGIGKGQMTPEQAMEMVRRMPLETQSQMVLNRIAEDQKRGVTGQVIPQDPTLRQKLSGGFQELLKSQLGMDNYRARRLSETVFGGDNSGVPLGIGLIDMTPFVLPLAGQESGMSAGNAFDAAGEGNYGKAALEYGMGVLQSLDTAPGVALAFKGAKAAGKALAPKAGEMIDSYLTKTGAILKMAPDSPRVDSIEKFPVGPSSIKPRVIAPDTPLHREMSADNLADFLRNDSQFSYHPTFVTDNADLAIGQGNNKGVKVEFRANSVSGEEHLKPMTGDIAGREYKANVFAPRAIESITFASESDLKKVSSFAAGVLKKQFDRVSDGTKNIVFVRKAPDSTGIEVSAAPKLNTPAFKKWFGDSKMVDEKGQPLVFYHGTKIQFEQFDPNIGYQGAMFFSPKREFAENYMAGTDVREPIAVYLSAKNPFDYDNPEHRKAVIELAIENTPLYKTAKDPKEMRRVLDEALTKKDANWTTIEEKGFQDAIKKLGFDSFFVKESGVKNIAVYDPTQIKSVFNKGTFDPKDPRILHGGGAVAIGAATQGEEKK